MKFRKKPVVIEAVQWGTNYRFSEVPNWLKAAIDNSINGGVLRCVDDIHVFTLEGVMVASPGDWIIRGIKGELYPCKPDIFAATYETVSDVH